MEAFSAFSLCVCVCVRFPQPMQALRFGASVVQLYQVVDIVCSLLEKRRQSLSSGEGGHQKGSGVEGNRGKKAIDIINLVRLHLCYFT